MDKLLDAGFWCRDFNRRFRRLQQCMPELMQQLNSCVEENLDEKCMAVAGFETAVMSIRNETQRVCSDGSVCSAYVSKCGCKVIPEGQSRPQTDHIAAICSGWPEAKKCLRDAPEKCKTNPKTQEFIDNFRTSNAIGYYMNCAKEGGVCGKTLRCLNAFNARFGRDNNGPDAICRCGNW
nr:hypothetical protein BaRGS_007639 [Batillaria attramentaria]